MSGSASMVWALPFTSRLIRAIGCMSPLGQSSFAAAAPPRRPVDLRDQLRMVLMREASPTARSLEHPRRGFLGGVGRYAPVGTRAQARRGARSPGHERVAADAMALQRLADASHRVVLLFTMSNSAVFFVPAARCCARVPSFSAFSLRRMG